MTNELQQQLAFLIEADKMKTILRQTLIADKSRNENDAEHSWHFALMALVLFEHAGFTGIDINRVIKMALIHDMVEIYAGDTFAYDKIGNQGKAEREKKAAEALFGILPKAQGDAYKALWEEFEEAKTQDAVYASAIDRLQPFINNYLTEGHTWATHNVSASQVYERMSPIKDALPSLWEYVEFVIKDSCEKGYLTTSPEQG